MRKDGKSLMVFICSLYIDTPLLNHWYSNFSTGSFLVVSFPFVTRPIGKAKMQHKCFRKLEIARNIAFSLFTNRRSCTRLCAPNSTVRREHTRVTGLSMLAYSRQACYLIVASSYFPPVCVLTGTFAHAEFVLLSVRNNAIQLGLLRYSSGHGALDSFMHHTCFAKSSNRVFVGNAGGSISVRPQTFSQSTSRKFAVYRYCVRTARSGGVKG